MEENRLTLLAHVHLLYSMTLLLPTCISCIQLFIHWRKSCCAPLLRQIQSNSVRLWERLRTFLDRQRVTSKFLLSGENSRISMRLPFLTQTGWTLRWHAAYEAWLPSYCKGSGTYWNWMLYKVCLSNQVSSAKQWNCKVEHLAGKTATDEADLKQLDVEHPSPSTSRGDRHHK